MQKKRKYKYQQQLSELIAHGCQLPPLSAIKTMEASRFVFSNDNRRNHIPQYMSNPRRMLSDISNHAATTSLLALSCFQTPIQASEFFNRLSKSFPRISQTIGDSLSEGILNEADGQITEATPNGHFDLYEYEGCDLNQTFTLTKTLI